MIGAFTLDDQRRTTFDEREQAASLAAQREQLLEVGHELNDVLDGTELGRRIVRRGRLLLDAESCALVLVDTATGAIRTTAIDGDLPPTFRAILDREATGSIDQPFFQELRRHVWVEIPGGGPLDALADELRETYGLRRLLLVPVQREGALLGYLAFIQLRPGPAVHPAQHRLAAGLAQLSAVALANAHLVAALQRADRVKYEFVSTMSHELRTPLGVIMGYTEILRGRRSEPLARRDRRIKRVERRAPRDGAGDVESERLEVRSRRPHDRAAVDQAVLGRARGRVRGAAARGRRGAPLRAGARRDARIRPPEAPHRREEPGRERAQVHRRAARSSPPSPCDARACTIVVRDTGIGIAEQDLPVIFEMFRQADSSDRRAYGGVGLGLHIVQRLVAQLGGRVDVASEPGPGSTFRIVLPAGAHR